MQQWYLFFTDSLHYFSAFLLVLHFSAYGRPSVSSRNIRNCIHLYSWMWKSTRDSNFGTCDTLAQVQRVGMEHVEPLRCRCYYIFPNRTSITFTTFDFRCRSRHILCWLYLLVLTNTQHSWCQQIFWYAWNKNNSILLNFY